MGGKVSTLVVLTTLTVLFISTAAAHVPRTASENESLEHAKIIDDPIKSWAIYADLREGDVANYYQMEMEEGERLYVSILLPQNEGFVPDLAIMGPGIDQNDTTPDFIEKPEDVGVEIIKGELDERVYEPFTPGSYYHPASYDQEIDKYGTYHVAVYNEEETGGKYGLAVGYRETWGPIEWIRLPIDVIQIRLWEGQPIWLIFAPMISVLGTGFVWTAWRKNKNKKIPKNLNEWGLLISSLLYIGSGAMMLMQTIIAASTSSPGIAVIVTLIFVLIPLIVGYKLWERSSDFKDAKREDKIKIVIFGLVGLLIWAGLIVGPLIAMISGILPMERS